MLGCTQEEIGRAGLCEVCMVLTVLKHSALSLFGVFLPCALCVYSHLSAPCAQTSIRKCSDVFSQEIKMNPGQPED